METAKINRLNIVLVEQGKTGKWLAGQLGKNEATISRWCSNTSQPSLEMLMKIAELLDVDSRDLIISRVNNNGDKLLHKLEKNTLLEKIEGVLYKDSPNTKLINII